MWAGVPQVPEQALLCCSKGMHGVHQEDLHGLFRICTEVPTDWHVRMKAGASS